MIKICSDFLVSVFFCGNIKLNYCMQFKNQQKLTTVELKAKQQQQ